MTHDERAPKTLAFNSVDVVVRVLLIIGVLAGLGIMFFPGRLPYPSWRSTIVTAVSIVTGIAPWWLLSVVLPRIAPSRRRRHRWRWTGSDAGPGRIDPARGPASGTP